MYKKLLVISVVVVLLMAAGPCSAQLWRNFRDAISGIRSSPESRRSTQAPPPRSSCDKGQSYSPDACNKCFCVDGSVYRCTLRYCDESLGSLDAFKFD